MKKKLFTDIIETTNLVVVAGTLVFSVYHLVNLAGDLVTLGVDELFNKRLLKKI